MIRLLAAILLLSGLAAAQEKKGTRYAFLVAVSKYDEDSGLKPLPFTVTDVEGFTEALLAAGYDAKNVRGMSGRSRLTVTRSWAVDRNQSHSGRLVGGPFRGREPGAQ